MAPAWISVLLPRHRAFLLPPQHQEEWHVCVHECKCVHVCVHMGALVCVHLCACGYVCAGVCAGVCWAVGTVMVWKWETLLFAGRVRTEDRRER